MKWMLRYKHTHTHHTEWTAPERSESIEPAEQSDNRRKNDEVEKYDE